MPRKPAEENVRAEHVNPEKSGIRTGNPQLAAHEGGDIRSQPRQRAPRPPAAKARRAPRKSGGGEGG